MVILRHSIKIGFDQGWTPAAWNTADEGGPDQRTPDLAAVLQEVVDRPGWASGNAVAFIITGSGKRIAKSYEKDMYGAPYLHIEYTLSTPTPTPTPTVTNTPTATATLTPTLTDTSTPTASATLSASLTPTLTATATAILTPTLTLTPTPTPIPSGPITINYVYDPLNRLTAADYTSTGSVQSSTGAYYHYTYDSVGNRLTQETGLGTTAYTYDLANRLTSVNGQNYTWDSNGNLLNDGVNTYAYNDANQLTGISNQSTVSSYQYSGLGDRLSQTVNGNTTNYTLDLNSGLTQVLNDGTNTYLYGVVRIAQVNTTTEYFLGDALGSVRQLTDASGEITLAKSYAPYGEVMDSAGSASSPFAFTGEQMDVSGLTYLRARYYSNGDGRFISRDTWMGDYNSPLSLNRWNYVQSNPTNFTDPSGHDGIPIGGGLASCFGVAFMVPDPGALETFCALIAAYTFLTTGVFTLQNLPEPGYQPYPGYPPLGEIPEIIPLDQILAECWLVIRPNPNPSPKSDPWKVPYPPKVTVLDKDSKNGGKTIVELGAGNYSNAISKKIQYPGSTIYATNLKEEWQFGKRFYETGLNDDNFLLRMYVGWLNAKKMGLIVGEDEAIENSDVPSGIGDIVYAIMPYTRNVAFQFGVDAARIASMESGTIVAVTEGGSGSSERFQMGFNSVRPGSVFQVSHGSPFGNPGLDWEAGPWITRTYVVP